VTAHFEYVHAATIEKGEKDEENEDNRDDQSLAFASEIVSGGDVHVSFDPTLCLHMEMHGSSVHVHEECHFDPYDVETLDEEDEDYVVATGVLQPSVVSSRPSLNSSSSTSSSSLTSGKINVSSAKDTAMTTSFFAKDNTLTLEEKLSHTTKEQPSLLVHSVSGSISVRQLSWMDNIRRQHLNKTSGSCDTVSPVVDRS
jgi:hypothetical protein